VLPFFVFFFLLKVVLLVFSLVDPSFGRTMLIGTAFSMISWWSLVDSETLGFLFLWSKFLHLCLLPLRSYSQQCYFLVILEPCLQEFKVRKVFVIFGWDV
jgi:membrane-bound ClpP family serine protease